MRTRKVVAGALVAAVMVAGCTRTRVVQRRVGRLPPLPTTSAQPASPGEPPIIWVGGTLAEANADRLLVRDSLGSPIDLLRLAAGATVFFRVAGSVWQGLPERDTIPTGGPACVETLMDGTNLVALRVFLGATCGPA